MTTDATIRSLRAEDVISDAFTELGRHKPVSTSQRYVAQQGVDNRPVEPGATIRVDDAATLMFSRELARR
jgi:hypothetical protein